MRLYDVLLHCYPRAFRDRYGDDMRRTFREDLARAGARGRVAAAWFWCGTVLHAAGFGLLERLPKGLTMRAFTVDLRDAVRSLRATPVLTAVALASLALGIGANTALFSILNGLTLKPLPVAHPEQLVLVDQELTNPIWEGIRAHAGGRGASDDRRPAFDGALAWSAQTFDLSTTGERDAAAGAYTSGDAFRVLGIAPIVGRTFTAVDDVPGGGPDGDVAVISERLWRARFAAAPDAIGRTLSVNRRPFRIIGVVPRAFFGMDVGRLVDVYLPISANAGSAGRSPLTNRATWWLDVYLRRGADQTVTDVQTALRAIQPELRATTVPLEWTPEMQEGFLKEPFDVVAAANGQSSLRARYQQPLTIVLGVVGAVLLIACANIANLLLARASGRRHELSVRVALGASRVRLIRQLLTESALLGAVGAVLGLVIAQAASRLLVRQLSTSVTQVDIDLSLDWSVLAFTAGTAAATVLIFGLAPAFGAARVAPGDALKEGARTVAGDRRFAFRNFLVIAQVALSLTLVVAAGLLVRTFASLASAPLGFDADRLTVASVTMGAATATEDARADEARRLIEAVSHVPGVQRAATVLLPPIVGGGWNSMPRVEDGLVVTGRARETWVNGVMPGYFETMGMTLLAGRDLQPTDTAHAPLVVVVNETFVRKFIGSGQPVVGRTVIAGLVGGPGVEDRAAIVGVVSDAIYRSVRQGPVPTMFLSMPQTGPMGRSLSVVVRTPANGAPVDRGVAAAVLGVDAQASVSFRTYSDVLRGVMTPERVTAMLSAFFGGLALLLAGLGFYGVTSYSVNLRRQEIAIRMALGADGARVMRGVLGRALVIVGVGLAIGVGLSVYLSKFVAALLFGLAPRDLTTLGTAAAVLAVTGLLAAWLPARRAARTTAVSVLGRQP